MTLRLRLEASRAVLGFAAAARGARRDSRGLDRRLPGIFSAMTAGSACIACRLPVIVRFCPLPFSGIMPI